MLASKRRSMIHTSASVLFYREPEISLSVKLGDMWKYSARMLKVKIALTRFEDFTRTCKILTTSEESSFLRTQKLISILSFSSARMKNRRNISLHTVRITKTPKGRDNYIMKSI